MLYTRLMKQFKSLRIRQLHSSFINYENKAAPNTTPSKPPNTDKHNILRSPLYNPSNFDKRILVWVKRYPSIDKVPNQVTIDCIQKAHSMARIRVCYIMAVFSIIGFIVSAILGKRGTATGNNILTEKLKWYKKVQEQGRREAESAKAQ